MLVQFKNATLGYHHHIILRDIDICLPHQEVCCVLGVNGCGKTTLLRSLLGLIPLISGEILLSDKPVTHWSPAALARTMAYVPQAHDSPFAFSVLDMVMMGNSMRVGLFSSPGLAERERARHTLHTLDIGHLEQRLYPTLSGGERQLVLIARALVQQPKLLVMDEPAASLDFGHQITLLEKIRQLKNKGMTLLMSTHHPMHALAVADNVVLVNPQSGVQQGTPGALLNSESLAALYNVQPEEIRRHLGIEQTVSL